MSNGKVAAGPGLERIAARDARAEQRGAVPAGVRARIRELLPTMPESEAAVAINVLGDPHSIVHLSVQALAGRSMVSTASVLRFCRTLGYAGYRDFKIALTVELGASSPATCPDAPAGRAIELASRVIEAHVAALRQTRDLLDEGALEEAARLLDAAPRIIVCGAGTAEATALDFAHRAMSIGLPVSAVTNPVWQATIGGSVRAGDVVVAVSLAGLNHSAVGGTVGAARQAREAGASVIGATTYRRNPLLDFADVRLIAASAETPMPDGAFVWRTALQTLLDALLAVLVDQRTRRALAADGGSAP